MVLSWLDASNLRNRVYEQAERIEILETALDDCARISNNELVKTIVKRALGRDHL
jgi:hypothetical protein